MNVATDAVQVFSPNATDRRAHFYEIVRAAVVVATLVVAAIALLIYAVQALTWMAHPTFIALIGPTQVLDAAPLTISTPWDGTENGLDVIVAVNAADPFAPTDS